MHRFSTRLLRWWRHHGRHDLPWQHPRTPYRVWVSEIMLQQTRVETVRDYFERFMQRFPDVTALAHANLDQVLGLWSGLGYYARARNLHAAAVRIVEEHDAQFPCSVDDLEALPGIGRSTAAAIVAQGFDRRAPILDGNVKRVLARHAGIEGWPGRTPVSKALWLEAEARTPRNRAADYTQAIMDLGATVCTPRAPDCIRCPVAEDCLAARQGRQAELPTPRPKRKLPEREQDYWIARDQQDRFLLVRRPPTGIWGGLWCLPERDLPLPRVRKRLNRPPPVRHVFSHFRLTMRFDHVRIDPAPASVSESSDLRWMTVGQWRALGLPEPVRSLLERIVEESGG